MLLISVRGWVDPRAIVRPEGLCQLIQGYRPLFYADIGEQLAHTTTYTKILSSWTLLDGRKIYILKSLLCNFALYNDASFLPEIQSECVLPASYCTKRCSKFNLKFCGYTLLRWWSQCNVYLRVSFKFPSLEFKTVILVMTSSKKKLWQTFVMPIFLRIYRYVWNTSWA